MTEIADRLPTLYQAEWCPFSSAVREVLTELGIDVIVRQVEPSPEQRAQLRAATGGDGIPALVTEDGQVLHGTREIFAHLRTLPAWEHAAAHRQRYADHRDARESDATGQMLRFFKGSGGLAAPEPGSADEPTVIDVPAEHRYELLLGDRRIGLLAYRQRDGRIALTHTEVDPSCQGRGFGGRLAAAALDGARRDGLAVVPLCPFVAAYIREHPEYRDLVAPRSAG